MFAAVRIGIKSVIILRCRNEALCKSIYKRKVKQAFNTGPIFPPSLKLSSPDFDKTFFL